MLNLEIKNQIKKLASLNLNEEICGLLIKKDNKTIIFQCKNISNNKSNHFILDPIDYIKADELGDIIALWHTQQNDGLSILDNIISFNHNIFSIVYCRESNKFYIIEPKLKDYLNRNFDISKSNCYHLVKDYLKDKRNININNYPVEKDWFENNPKLIYENFIKEGGIEIDINDIKKDDIIFFGENKLEINHMGIYIGNDMILHQQINRNSCIEYLNHHYRNKIQMIIRHKDCL